MPDCPRCGTQHAERDGRIVAHVCEGNKVKQRGRLGTPDERQRITDWIHRRFNNKGGTTDAG